MCAIDWGLFAAWLAAAGSVGTLVAAIALNTWRAQARGAAAQEVKTAAWALRYAFYGARSPLIQAWEFPDEYHLVGEHRSRVLIADSHQKVYNNRWQELWPYLKAVAKLRAKAGALFGDDAATACETLAKTARHLQYYMEEHVGQLRAGDEVVRQWTDQDFVKLAKQSVYVDFAKKEDKFSKEFEAAFEALLNMLQPHS